MMVIVWGILNDLCHHGLVHPHVMVDNNYVSPLCRTESSYKYG
jgi:hypothetical protein